MKKDSGESDIYRDSYIRYLGYTNEVGEAFRPLVPRSFVNLSYAIAVGYVLADVYDKAKGVHNRANTKIKDVAKVAGDVFIWQILASVVIPGLTIHRITRTTGLLVRKMKVQKSFAKIIPTGVGLASIPIIIKPIDTMVDILMDHTYRKYL